jgi:hypothetical protein
VPWLHYLAIVGRRVVETVGGMLHAMFPRRIHAVTQEGFVIKVRSFVLAHDLKLPNSGLDLRGAEDPR